MVGTVALLRASGRGRSGWEILVLGVMAVLPPVIMCLHEYFHPQDLVAVGFILAGLACVRRGSWGIAGLLLGLAVASQQFALLALAPLVVIAPRDRLIKFGASAVGSMALVVVPLAIFTPAGALRSLFVGSGTTWTSDTLLATHLSGDDLEFVARFAPIAAALVLAWWSQSRLGSSVLEPVPLIALVATSLSFRLVFEVNLWGYYFMAVAVMVLVLDAVGGRLRWTYLAWIALITVSFPPVYGGIGASSLAAAPNSLLPLWAWQLVLSSLGTFIAISPLLREVGRRQRPATL